MKIVDPGHVYHVANLDDPIKGFQVLTFVKREGAGYPGNVGRHPGTTCQEVLRVLLARVSYLEEQEPSEHNTAILDGLATALHAFETRAAQRHGRPVPSLWECLAGKVCDKCGHVGCKGGCK